MRVGDLLGLLAEPSDQSFVVPNPGVPKLKAGVPVFDVRGLSVEYSLAEGAQKVGLRQVGFRVMLGEKVGIAGPSGCGKSTLLRVLLRLTHPSEGEVRFGGVALGCISREAIAENIGYVSQTPFLFAGTVQENIAYECRDASFDDISRAATMAGIHDEIMSMPFGYGSVVLERGQNLAGGQRQRIALARVFLKNPPVIILDEGTSALDTINERHVQNALLRMSGDHTLILVAHRLRGAGTERPASLRNRYRRQSRGGVLPIFIRMPHKNRDHAPLVWGKSPQS